MRRLGGLFDEMVSSPALWRAWRTFRRGKRGRSSVRSFEVDAERHILRLHRELAVGSYRPRGYRLRLIVEPKRRLIAAAPVRDRVVHHAVHQALAPALDRRLVEQTYACLPGRGSHRAVLAFLVALRRYRWALQLDIRHYFLSIHRPTLLHLMERSVKDRRVLELLTVIAESGEGLYAGEAARSFLDLEMGFPPPGCGLPIGNLTSQWWGNHYLSGADHFVLRELRVGAYQRYMDDLTLFDDSRERLVEARDRLARWLGEERRLRLKRPDAEARRATGAFSYLGYRVSRRGVEPLPAALARARHALGERVRAGSVDSLERSIASVRGWLGFPHGG